MKPANITFEKIGDVYLCKDIGGFHWFSKRYKKWMWIPYDHPSNGANLVADLCPEAFFIHDMACHECAWADGTLMTNWQASAIYADILYEAGFKFRSVERRIATFIGGGTKIKKRNGWFKVRKSAILAQQLNLLKIASYQRKMI